MIRVSDIYTTPPAEYSTEMQKTTYKWLEKLGIPFERVDNDEAITMEDCEAIETKMNMKMVKTLFLCNRSKTVFNLLIMPGDKPFISKNYSVAAGTSRMSFAPAELFPEMLGVKIGATTVFCAANDPEKELRIVIDSEVLSEDYFGCSDGTTTGYLKLRTDDVLNRFLPATDHPADIIDL